MLATIFAVVFGLIMGLAFTFYGLRVFLVLLPVWGFFAGLWLGAQGVSLLLGEAFLVSTAGFLIALALGIAFCLLSYLSFEFGVALVTVVFGISLVTGIMQALGYDSGLFVALAALAITIILVWLLFRFHYDRYLVIVITSLGGASLIVAAGLLVAGRIELNEVVAAGNALGPVLRDSWVWMLVWLALTAVGIFSQLRAHRGFDFTKHDLVQGWS